MNTFHFFYTREGQLPTGVNIKAENESDALKLFNIEYDYEDIIYITKLETLWSLKKTL